MWFGLNTVDNRLRKIGECRILLVKSFTQTLIHHKQQSETLKNMRAAFREISKQILDELATADKSICIAVAWFTNEAIFDLLLDKIRNGVTVELIVNNDHINIRHDGLEFNEFIRLGGKFFFADSTRLMHHKFVIIDNHKIISGSYNWTYNAEYRNSENVIFTDNPTTIEEFIKEFNCQKKIGLLQTGPVEVKLATSSEIDVNKYLKDDYYFKSVAEEKKGNLKKSLEAIQAAKEIDQTDLKITERVAEVQQRIEHPRYDYHIEDGQFSYDFSINRLLGNEGQIIKYYTERNGNFEDEFYILYIDGFNVECVGNIERSFPTNKQEHDELKEQMIKLYKDL